MRSFLISKLSFLRCSLSCPSAPCFTQSLMSRGHRLSSNKEKTIKKKYLCRTKMVWRQKGHMIPQAAFVRRFFFFNLRPQRLKKPGQNKNPEAGVSRCNRRKPPLSQRFYTKVKTKAPPSPTTTTTSGPLAWAHSTALFSEAWQKIDWRAAVGG